MVPNTARASELFPRPAEFLPRTRKPNWPRSLLYLLAHIPHHLSDSHSPFLPLTLSPRPLSQTLSHSLSPSHPSLRLCLYLRLNLSPFPFSLSYDPPKLAILTLSTSTIVAPPVGLLITLHVCILFFGLIFFFMLGVRVLACW